MFAWVCVLSGAGTLLRNCYSGCSEDQLSSESPNKLIIQMFSESQGETAISFTLAVHVPFSLKINQRSLTGIPRINNVFGLVVFLLYLCSEKCKVALFSWTAQRSIMCNPSIQSILCKTICFNVQLLTIIIIIHFCIIILLFPIVFY